MTYAVLVPNPFPDPISVILRDQNAIEYWSAHGSLAIIRKSTMVVNHGKRWEDDDEPRMADYREISNDLTSRATANSSKINEPKIPPRGSHITFGLSSNEILDKDPLWNTLALECKALFKSAQLSLQDHETEASIYTVLRTLDLIILTYAGAHVADLDDSPSRFGQKRYFFKIAGRKAYRGRRPCPPQIGAITLARRTLRCLDGFFPARKVWVFHEESVNPRSNARLLLSATPEDFADIWGPMWKIKDHENPSGILRYDLENGSIVSSELNRGVNEVGIALEADEDLCHWLSDFDFRRSEPSQSIPSTTFLSKPKLLIGAKRVRLKVNKEKCECTPAGITKQLRNADLLRPSGTSRDRRRIDAETVNIGMSGGITPFQVNYAFTTKTDVGRTFKESLIKRWTLQNHKRNAYVLLKYQAVEMSFCTQNSRRIRLIDLLITQPLSNLIKDIDPIEDVRCKEAVEEALQSEPEKIINLYFEHSEWRKDIGNLVICCLETLLDTGTTKAMGEPLSLFWMHDHEEYIVRYPSRTFRWSGFIRDLDNSSSFVVLEEKCLVFKLGRGCQHPAKELKAASQQAATEDCGPVFQTAILINDLLSLPPGLKLVKSETAEGAPEEPPHWKVRKLAPGSMFPMGDQGTLEVIKPLPNSTLLAKSIPKNPIKAAVKDFIANFADKRSALHHFEVVTDTLEGDYSPIGVFIIA